MKPLTTLAACAAALGAPLAASATDFDTLNNLSQAEFALFTKDLGAATSYKQLASAAPLGVAGFDIAVASAFTNTQYPDLWSKAAGNADIPGTVPVPGIRIAKGLPFGIDIGATYATLPKVDPSWPASNCAGRCSKAAWCRRRSACAWRRRSCRASTSCR